MGTSACKGWDSHTVCTATTHIDATVHEYKPQRFGDRYCASKAVMSSKVGFLYTYMYMHGIDNTSLLISIIVILQILILLFVGK